MYRSDLVCMFSCDVTDQAHDYFRSYQLINDQLLATMQVYIHMDNITISPWTIHTYLLATMQVYIYMDNITITPWTIS